MFLFVTAAHAASVFELGGRSVEGDALTLRADVAVDDVAAYGVRTGGILTIVLEDSNLRLADGGVLDVVLEGNLREDGILDVILEDADVRVVHPGRGTTLGEEGAGFRASGAPAAWWFGTPAGTVGAGGLFRDAELGPTAALDDDGLFDGVAKKDPPPPPPPPRDNFLYGQRAYFRMAGGGGHGGSTTAGDAAGGVVTAEGGTCFATVWQDGSAVASAKVDCATGVVYRGGAPSSADVDVVEGAPEWTWGW